MVKETHCQWVFCVIVHCLIGSSILQFFLCYIENLLVFPRVQFYFLFMGLFQFRCSIMYVSYHTVLTGNTIEWGHNLLFHVTEYLHKKKKLSSRQEWLLLHLMNKKGSSICNLFVSSFHNISGWLLLKIPSFLQLLLVCRFSFLPFCCSLLQVLHYHLWHHEIGDPIDQ